MNDVTRLLDAVERGEPQAAEELLPLVYEELRRLAAHKMASQPPGQTLQATALVHEAYLRLVGDLKSQSWNSRAHFFSAAAEAMRRILVERARRIATEKRGGRLTRVDLDEVDVADETNSDLLLLLDDALERLAAFDPTSADLIKLRFFVGLPNDRAAEILNVAERTAKRNWAFARAWLYRELHQELGRD